MNEENKPQGFDPKSLIAVLLCALFYLAYSSYMTWKYPPPPPQTTAAATSQPGNTPSNLSNEGRPEETKAPGSPQASNTASLNASEKDQMFTAQEAVMETSEVLWELDPETPGFKSVKLKQYPMRIKDPTNEPTDLLDAPIVLRGYLTESEASAGVRKVVKAQSKREGSTFTYWRVEQGILIQEKIAIKDDLYTANVTLSFTNTTQDSLVLTGGILWESPLKPKKASSLLGFIPGVVTQKDQLIEQVDGSAHWTDLASFCKKPELLEKKGKVEFFGSDRHYFMALVEPEGKQGILKTRILPDSAQLCRTQTTLTDSLGTLKPQDTVELKYDLYFGPKEIGLLEKSHPELIPALHLGFFDFIGKPLLFAIKFIHSLVGNHGVAIILLTVLLKILFYPLVKSSQASMHKMKLITPELNLLKERYKNDKQRQQQEIMKLMSKHKVNPAKGCLPILPQIPVFFAFYQVLQTSIQLRHAPFFGWIQDLAVMDPYYVTPLVLGVAMFVQQKMTPTTGMDKTQERILLFMPVMFTAMMLTLPAGLTLYMLTNTLVGIAQQRWLNYKLNATDNGTKASKA